MVYKVCIKIKNILNYPVIQITFKAERYIPCAVCNIDWDPYLVITYWTVLVSSAAWFLVLLIMFPTGKYLKVWFLGPYTFDNFEFGIGQLLMEISFWLVGETLGGWGTEIRVTYSSLIQLRCSKGLRSGKLPAVTVIVLPSRPRAKSTGTQAPLKLQLELFFKFFFSTIMFFP